MKHIMLFLVVLPLSLLAQRGGGGRDNGPSFSWSGDGKGNGIPTLFTASLGVSYGAVAGSGSTSVFAGKNDWRPGVHFGLAMTVPVSQQLFIRPELSATQIAFGDQAKDYSASLWYFDMPVLGSYALSSQSSFHVLTGPQLGFLVSASETDHGVRNDIRQSLKTMNLSWVAGMEWMPGTVGVSLRYAHGFSNLYSPVGKAASSPDYSGRTRVLSLSLTCKLGGY